MLLDYIDLEGQEFFAQGAWKSLYKVPNHPDLCVSVLREDEHQKRPWYFFWRSKYINSELYRTFNQYRYIKKYKPHLLQYIVPTLGIVPTSKGDGLVCALITDDDQQVSKHFPLGLNQEQAISALQQMQQQGLRIFDPNPKNALLQQKNGEYHVMWIESYESPYPLWMSRLLKPYLDYRSQKAWKLLFKRLGKYFP